MSDADGSSPPPPLQTRAELEVSLAEYEAQLQQVLKRREIEKERGVALQCTPPTRPGPGHSLSLFLSHISSSSPHRTSQVTSLLATDPANAEYLEIKAGLDEVIELTRDLAREAGGDGVEGTAGAAAAPPSTATAAPPAAAQAPKRSRWESVGEAPAGEASTAAPPSTARLPPTLTLPGEGEEEAWEAAAGEAGAPAPDDSELAYAALPAPKRGKVATTPAVVEEMPAWMVISAEDDEKVRAKKLKLQKSFKQKQRFAAMDLAASQKANSWQAFASGKGAKAKPSLFATGGGVGARVGVVGGGGRGAGSGSGRGRLPPPVRAGAPASVVRRKAPPPPPPPAGA